MKKINTIVICAILTTSFFSAHSQKQNNIWCFGDNAEVNFNSGSPVSNTSCAIFSAEGCASIADAATGQLLFYSDGSYVWNANNVKMPSNTIPLGGNVSSTQSALIIPMPGNTHEYYMFCTDAQAGLGNEGTGGDSGTQYCIIDMDLDGGLGDVAQQPTRLLTPTCEKMAATPMPNNQGYWFVIHLWNSDAFYSYPITSGGVGAPVISHAGIVMSDPDGANDNEEAVGYMRISPDQTKIAVAVDWVLHTLQVFNFNDSTGTIAGPIFSDSLLEATNDLNGPYGLCWSPNSQFLYFTIESDYNVQQFNMNAGSPGAILASLTTVGTPVGEPLALQLGNDNKIYASIYGNGNLDCIRNPNNAGAACNYQADDVSLYNGTSCTIGLPELVPPAHAVCQAATVNIIANKLFICPSGNASVCAPPGYSTYQWNGGDTGNCTEAKLAGNYYVIVTDSNGCTAMSNSVNITVLPSPEVTVLHNLLTVCASDSALLCASGSFTLYQWNLGETDSCIEASHSGSYYVIVTDSNGCTDTSASVPVTVYPASTLTITQNGDTLNSSMGSMYQWYRNGNPVNGADGAAYIAIEPGSYTVTATDINGCPDSSTPIIIITGINNLIEPNISLYPNPTSDKWQLTVENSLLGSKLEVFDDNGKTVYESEISNLKTEINFNASSGVYLLRIASENVNVVRKLVKL